MTQAVRYCNRCGGRLARDNTDTWCAACNHAARDTLLRPPVVPPEFWDTDHMRDALATWHMGRVVFAYRMHPYHGRPLTQEIVGNWLGLTQAQLSRIENGRAPEELSKLIRYAQILGIPAQLLWFALPEQPRPDVLSGPGRSQAMSLPVILNGRSILLPIDADTARANGLDSLLDDYGQQTAVGADDVSALLYRGMAAHALPASDLDELEHVAAALDDARRYLDGSVVDYFRQQLDRSKADDGNLGPTKALPLVLGILGAISQHAREVKPGVRFSLLSLGADGAEFVGWLYRDLQDPSNAHILVRPRYGVGARSQRHRDAGICTEPISS